MTAALTIGPDGVARIEIVLRLDIVLRTEEVARAAGVRVRDDGDEHHAVDGRHEPGRGDGLADDGGPGPERGGGHSAGGTDVRKDGASAEPAVDAVAIAPHAQAPDGVEAVSLPPLPPTDTEPQPAAEAGGEPKTAGPAGAAAPVERIKRPARKTAPDAPDQISRREIAIAAYERGATFFEAGREARVSHVTVGNWVRDAGLPVRVGAWKRPAQYPRAATPKPAAAPEPARPVTPRPLAADEAEHPETEHAAADDPPALVKPNPGGDHEVAPAPTAADATGKSGIAGAGGGDPSIDTASPEPPRAARPSKPQRRPVQHAPPPLPGKPAQALTAAEIEAAQANGRFQRLPAIDERLGKVPLVESVEDALRELQRLGHKVRTVGRNAFRVDARQFDRISLLAHARSAVRMEAARSKGLVA